ncbi:MAG: T9SS type A sorting domain-containing protein [Thermotogae bacterium]|nr:T9SS type A sorting domain-containing protein [Thermotogota bacterium]
MYFLIALTTVSLFKEEFDRGQIPVGWRATGTWTVGILPEWSPSTPPYAFADARFSLEVSDTLITPTVGIGFPYDSLSLIYAIKYLRLHGGEDSVKVLLRRFSGGWGSWEVLKAYASTTERVETLKVYPPADSLQIAFLYLSPSPAVLLSLDNIEIQAHVSLEYDLQALSIIAPPYAFVDSSVSLGFTVRNGGAFSDSVAITYGHPSSLDTVSLTLDPDEDTTLWATYTFYTPAYVLLHLMVSSPNDTFPFNDTLTLPLRVIPTPTSEVEVPFSEAALIDGIVRVSDYTTPWEIAGRLEASDWLGGIPMEACTLLLAWNDGGVDLALITSADPYLSEGDRLILALDGDMDGYTERLNYIYPLGWYSVSDGIPRSRPDLGPYYAFSYTNSGFYRLQMEVRIRFSPSYDPAALPYGTDTFGLAIEYFDQGNGRVVCRWPQTSDLSSSHGDVFLTPRVSVTETIKNGLPFRLESNVLTLEEGELYSSSGRLLLKGKGNIKLPVGIYFVRSGSATFKVVVGP